MALSPDFAAAHANLANALFVCGRVQEAVASYRRALLLQPSDAQVYSNLAAALSSTGNSVEAIAMCQRGLQLRGDFPLLHNNLGNAFAACGRLEEAIGSYRRAVALQPNFALALSNLGTALAAAGQTGEAIKCHRRAIAIDPRDAQSHYNLSLALLLCGSWEEGWKEYEWRLMTPPFTATRRQFARPRWDGVAPGKTVLLHAEQGFGDTIQFLRYIPLIINRGGRVLLEVQPALLRLLRGDNSLGATVLPQPAAPAMPPNSAYDAHLPLMSLPLALACPDVSGEPKLPRPPYLRAPDDLKAQWRSRVGDGPKLKVGIVWAGNPSHRYDRERSLALQALAPLAGAKARFYSLQLGEAAKDAMHPPAGMTLIDLTQSITDFADTAALVEELELIIGVDTAVCHLAGAMGKPVWLLLPFSPDFRWQLHREETPLYPKMRLFRQATSGDWSAPIERISLELRRLSALQGND
jgi:Tfp pilus assembly protein PilF